MLMALFFLHFFLLSIKPNFRLIRFCEVMPIPLQGQMLLKAMSLNKLKGRRCVSEFRNPDRLHENEEDCERSSTFK